MKIALAQLDPTIGDLAGNVARLVDAHRRAREAGCQAVFAPEMAVTGYPPKDLLDRPGFVREVGRAVAELARATRDGPVLVAGAVEPNPEPEGRKLFNVAVVLRKGELVATIRKRLLPTYDVFDEDRYFEPGAVQSPFAIEGVPFGITICEDTWNPASWAKRRLHHKADPIADAARAGARVLVNLSASPFYRGKVAVREELVRTHVRAHGLPFLFVNQTGGQDDLVFDGSSFALDARGQVRARALGFEEDLVVLDVDPTRGTVEGPLREAPASGSLDEVYAALVAGTRDYARKCGFKTALLGLSGGIDSALTAVIAADALGPSNVLGVSMPSRYSSPGSKDDARDLARNLGLRYTTVPIEPMFQAFLAQLAPEFAGRPEDVTEENVQARIRGTILMGLSNKSGALLLSTGNKSEMATGYCTLYGDMAGGLAVISDVPKLLVYELSRWLNRKGERIPRSSIEKAPSAELKPGQTDQDTLPPFDVLDPLLELYVEEALEPDELVARGFDARVVRDVVRMINVAEYKRKQAAPGIKVTSKAFGAGRRYPIAKRLTVV